ncbi:MAG: hypothetical protein AAFR23_07630, partial [Pseudomonadota bacterium]
EQLARKSVRSDVWLSAALCVVFPVTFWLLAILAVDHVAGLGLSALTYTILLAGMLTVLVPVWASLVYRTVTNRI